MDHTKKGGNPIGYDDNEKGWFFWDEEGISVNGKPTSNPSKQHGFWDTEEKAKEEFARYCTEELKLDISKIPFFN
jgi:hypothetical protein